MFILQRLPSPVNVQVSYIFQLFFERSTKAPGSGVLLGAGCNYCAAVLVSSKPMAT